MTYGYLKQAVDRLHQRLNSLRKLIEQHQECCSLSGSDDKEVAPFFLATVKSSVGALPNAFFEGTPKGEAFPEDIAVEFDPTALLSVGTWVMFSIDHTPEIPDAEVYDIGLITHVRTTRADDDLTEIPVTYRIIRAAGDPEYNGTTSCYRCPGHGHVLKVIRPFTRAELEALPKNARIKYRTIEPDRDGFGCRLSYSNMPVGEIIAQSMRLSGDDKAPLINGKPQEFYFARGAILRLYNNDDWQPFCKVLYTVKAK